MMTGSQKVAIHAALMADTLAMALRMEHLGEEDPNPDTKMDLEDEGCDICELLRRWENRPWRFVDVVGMAREVLNK